MEEVARDVHAASRLLTTKRLMIDECRASSGLSLDKRKKIVSAKFPAIIEGMETLDSVLPNIHNWLASHAEADDETASLAAVVDRLNERHDKSKTKFISAARVMAGQTSKRFRSLSNQVKVHLDDALYGTYKTSKMSLLMLPTADAREPVTAVMLSYSDLRDASGYVYPKFFSYIYETAAGVEVRSSPFFSLTYRKGEAVKTAPAASRILLARLTAMGILPEAERK